MGPDVDLLCEREAISDAILEVFDGLIDESGLAELQAGR